MTGGINAAHRDLPDQDNSFRIGSLEQMKEATQQERELPVALRAAYMALHHNTDAEFAEHGMTADQFDLLLALSEDQALTQRELADRISSDPSTVRAMLVLLER